VATVRVVPPSAYEYIRVQFDPNDLEGLNSLGSDGFHVVQITDGYALLEREIHEERQIAEVREYYSKPRHDRT